MTLVGQIDVPDLPNRPFSGDDSGTLANPLAADTAGQIVVFACGRRPHDLGCAMRSRCRPMCRSCFASASRMNKASRPRTCSPTWAWRRTPRSFDPMPRYSRTCTLRVRFRWRRLRSLRQTFPAGYREDGGSGMAGMTGMADARRRRAPLHSVRRFRSLTAFRSRDSTASSSRSSEAGRFRPASSRRSFNNAASDAVSRLLFRCGRRHAAATGCRKRAALAELFSFLGRHLLPALHHASAASTCPRRAARESRQTESCSEPARPAPART